jgi:two-component sensor histidine kinase
VQVSGPPVALTFDVVQSVGLALHELSTNAVKHGALTDTPGLLEVSWAVRGDDGQRRLAVDWVETGVANAGSPQRKGFGRELIERTLGSLPDAKSQMDFTTDGLKCHFELALIPAQSFDHVESGASAEARQQSGA